MMYLDFFRAILELLIDDQVRCDHRLFSQDPCAEVQVDYYTSFLLVLKAQFRVDTQAPFPNTTSRLFGMSNL